MRPRVVALIIGWAVLIVTISLGLVKRAEREREPEVLYGGDLVVTNFVWERQEPVEVTGATSGPVTLEGKAEISFPRRTEEK